MEIRETKPACAHYDYDVTDMVRVGDVETLDIECNVCHKTWKAYVTHISSQS